MTEKERAIEIYRYLVGVFYLSPASQEPYFSKEPCSCCGSTLAGDRYDFTGTIGKKHGAEKITENCCIDCFHYLFC